jgi:hypothetical protein
MATKWSTKVIDVAGDEHVTPVTTLDDLVGFSIKHVATGTAWKDMPIRLVDFSESFTPTWKKEAVYGRMDPVASFQGTQRSITFSFTVDPAYGSAAKDRKLLKSGPKQGGMIQAFIGDLAKMMYPLYESTAFGSNLMASPLVRINLANFTHNHVNPDGLLCIIDTIDFGKFYNTEKVNQVVTNTSTPGARFLAPNKQTVTLTATILHEEGKVGFAYVPGAAGDVTMAFGQGAKYPHGQKKGIARGRGINNPSSQLLDMRTLSDDERETLEATYEDMLVGSGAQSSTTTTPRINWDK